MKTSLEEKNKRFFNKMAKHYDVRLFKNWRIKIIKKIIKIADIKNKSCILDAGCGTGEFLAFLFEIHKNKNLKLYGIDISEEMLKIAGEKLKNKAKLKLSSVEKTNFKNNFDYIFSEDAFHHYSNYDSAMKNFYKLLKKNGKLIIADFDFGFIGNKIFHLIEPGNNKMHSPLEFKKLFREYGFKKIKQIKLGWFYILTIGEKWKPKFQILT